MTETLFVSGPFRNQSELCAEYTKAIAGSIRRFSGAAVAFENESLWYERTCITDAASVDQRTFDGLSAAGMLMDLVVFETGFAPEDGFTVFEKILLDQGYEPELTAYGMEMDLESAGRHFGDCSCTRSKADPNGVLSEGSKACFNSGSNNNSQKDTGCDLKDGADYLNKTGRRKAGAVYKISERDLQLWTKALDAGYTGAALDPDQRKVLKVQIQEGEAFDALSLNDKSYAFRLNGQSDDETDYGTFFRMPSVTMYGYEVSGEIVSTLMLFLGSDAGIHEVATLSGHRNKGYAGKLLNRALLDAKTLGYKKAVLLSTPEGHGLYLKAGFKDKSLIRHFRR